MSILDTFGILFESDTDDLEKGADKAGEAVEGIGESADKAGQELDTFGDSFLGLIQSATVKYISLASVAGVAAGVIAQAARTDELGKFSDVLGLNVEDVDAWSQAVVRSGGDASAFRGTIESLTDKLTDFNLTGGGEAATVLSRLGVNARDAGGKVKTAFELLPDLADSFQQLSKAESLAFGRKLGLDQGTILLLQSGRAAVDDLVRRQRTLGTVTKEDTEIAAKFNDQWADTKQVFSSLARATGSTLLPVFTSILEVVEDVTLFLADHKEVVVAFFSAAAAIVTIAYLPAILSATAATVAAYAPFIAIGAAVTAAAAAFALIYEDVMAFIAGEESLIGRLTEDFPWIEKLVMGVADAFNFMFGVVRSVFDFLFGSLPGITDLFGSLIGAAGEIFDILGSLLTGKFASVFDKFASFFGFGSEDEPAEEIDRTGRLTPTEAEELQRQVDANIKMANENPLNAANSNVMNRQTAIHNNTSVNVGEVNVDARGGDSAEIAAGTRSALNDEMERTVNWYDDGLAY